ncbi:MAG: hypothetical protein GF331_25510 [Chitinivibrionales bacterium]|nr:hypothetical protein [Chitinivibrionales bacterium]
MPPRPHNPIRNPQSSDQPRVRERFSHSETGSHALFTCPPGKPVLYSLQETVSGAGLLPQDSTDRHSMARRNEVRHCRPPYWDGLYECDDARTAGPVSAPGLRPRTHADSRWPSVGCSLPVSRGTIVAKGEFMRTSTLLLGAVLAANASAYTTDDGKAVPPLGPPANVVHVSTATELRDAINGAESGQTILLAEGVYDISSLEPLTIRTAGTTLRGATGDPTDVVVRGKGFESCDNVDEEMLMLFNSHITIAELTITESRCHGLKIEHTDVDSLLLHNVRFVNIGERCIKGGSSYNPEHNTIRYCHFENTKIPAADRCGAHFDGNYIGGMDVMNAAGWTVHDNVFRNIKGASGGGRGGIFFWRGCRDMRVERNTFVGCDVAIAFGNPSGNEDVTGGIIRNNFIVKGAYIALEVCNSSAIEVYANTIYSDNPTYFRTISYYQCGTGNMFKDNIVFGRFWEKDGTVPDTANNIWRSSSGDQSTDWFVDPSTGDLHLTPSATEALDAALGFATDDWDGDERPKSPDIGADELGTVAIVADSRAARPGNARAAGHQAILRPHSRLVCEVPGSAHAAVPFRLKLYDGTGRFIRTLDQGVAHPGARTVSLEELGGRHKSRGQGLCVLVVETDNASVPYRLLLVQ